MCAGTETRKKCVTPMPTGGPCRNDPFWLCAEGLSCINNECVPADLPEGGDCLPEGAKCMEGTVCAGSPRRKRCVAPMGEGGRCGVDPRWVCAAGLQCRRKKCVVVPIPSGGDCLPEGAICVTGTVCAGSLRRKRCVVPMGKGGRCGQDPRWICAVGLECRRKVCVQIVIPTGGDCSEEGVVCEERTVCAGRKNQRCVVPMQEGERCGQDPRWICAAGLECKHKKCVPITVPKGGDCSSEGSICEYSTVCAGRKNRRCVVPMPEGGSCGRDPRWICEEGLECRRKKCVRITVPKGDDCSPEGSVCEDGTVCAGRKNRKCVVPMQEGDTCGQDPRWVCGEGLECVRKVCTKSEY